VLEKSSNREEEKRGPLRFTRRVVNTCAVSPGTIGSQSFLTGARGNSPERGGGNFPASRLMIVKKEWVHKKEGPGSHRLVKVAPSGRTHAPFKAMQWAIVPLQLQMSASNRGRTKESKDCVKGRFAHRTNKSVPGKRWSERRRHDTSLVRGTGVLEEEVNSRLQTN